MDTPREVATAAKQAMEFPTEWTIVDDGSPGKQNTAREESGTDDIEPALVEHVLASE